MNLFNEDIEQIAIERIKTFCPEEGYYVATSFGKDSIVVMDLVKRSGVKADYHFNRTSVDPPELIAFGKKNYNNVEWHKPEKTMFQLIIANGIPPLRNKRYCCRVLKEHGGDYRVVITGIRARESTHRSKRKMVEFCNTQGVHKRYLHPIIDWQEDDVWKYIINYKLPYPSLYNEGFKRIGCIGCPMSSNIKQQFQRYPNFFKAYLWSFAKIVERQKQKGKTITWNTPQIIYDWWVHENKKSDQNQQCFVFD